MVVLVENRLFPFVCAVDFRQSRERFGGGTYVLTLWFRG